MFAHRLSTHGIDLVVTDRDGGVSEGPWSTLNLSAATGDDARRVEANASAVREALAAEHLVAMTQVHGADVAWVDGPGEAPVADALVTGRPGVALLVRVADCVPVVLAAPDERLAAVAHSGREGLVKGIVPATVAVLRERGARRLQAWVGPRACGRCYELPESMADAVAAVVPGSRSTTSWGTPAVDIGAGVVAQLTAAGVEVSDLGADTCTIEDDRWFSHRRQGAASGRFGAAVVIR